MTDDEDGVAALFGADEAMESGAEFALHLERRLRRARLADNLVGAATVAGIVIALGAAMSLSLVFLGLARGGIAGGPAWDITQAAFWLPYAVVSVTLAVFLRELIVRAVRRYFRTA